MAEGRLTGRKVWVVHGEDAVFAEIGEQVLEPPTKLDKYKVRDQFGNTFVEFSSNFYQNRRVAAVRAKENRKEAEEKRKEEMAQFRSQYLHSARFRKEFDKFYKELQKEINEQK